MNKKTVLVTGGCGFIGANLCKYLVNSEQIDYTVICVDNLYSSDINNIVGILSKNNFTFLNKNINNLKVSDLPKGKIDEIYHLACPASPKIYQKDPIYTLNTCYIGTKNILDIAIAKGAKLLFTSTSEVYGDPQVEIQSESYYGNVNCVGPRSCYDEGKRVAETLVMEYKKKYNMDAKIVRIFNTYGYLMNKNDGRVISNFINQALENKPLTIYGKGTQTRSFCFIDDMIKGLERMMSSTEQGPINLGNPYAEITILDLAKKVLKLLDRDDSNIEFSELPVNDPSLRKPNIIKATSLLNWIPVIDLDEGIKKTIEYYKKLN